MPAGTVRKSLKRFLRFVSLGILFFPLYALPRPLARSFGAMLGELSFWCLPGLRKRSQDNLALAFPDWPSSRRRRVARGVNRWIGRTGSDFLRMGGRGRTRLLQTIEVEGMEHWREALLPGRGIVAVTGHFGNWELLGAYIATLGRPIHVLYHPFREKRLERLVQGVRRRAGVNGLPADRSGFRALRALHRGEIVGVLVDRAPRGPSVECRFFARECRTAPGAAWLAVRAGAPLVPVALWNVPGGRHRLRIAPALPPLPSGISLEARVEALTRRLTASLEEQIREAPEQWPWFYERWRIRGRE